MRSIKTVVSLLCFALAACGGHSHRGPLQVHLTYGGPDSGMKLPAVKPCGSVLVRLELAVKEPGVIGKNLQSSTPIPITADPAEVQGYLSKSIESELERLSFKLAKAPESAKKTLVISVTQLQVEEDNTYNALVDATVDVRGPNGAVLTQRMVRGDGKRWGRSLDASEYNKALNNAVVSLLNRILEDEELMKALATGC